MSSGTCSQRENYALTNDDPPVPESGTAAAATQSLASDAILLAIESLRDDVRRVGRAVLTARPEVPLPSAAQNIDHGWAFSLLPLVDSLSRCRQAARVLGGDLSQPRGKWWAPAPADPRAQTVADGLALAEATLEGVLSARGYRLDRPVLVAFDAARHRAVAVESAGAFVPSTEPLVLRTESAGLWYGDLLLREAGVVVSASTMDKA